MSQLAIISGPTRRANAMPALTKPTCSEVNVAEKKCTKCDALLPLGEFYFSKKRGHMSWCKKCQAEYARQWRAKDPEKYRAWHRDYRKKNPEKVREYVRNSVSRAPKVRALYTSRCRQRDPARALYHAAKHRAKLYGIEFSITMADIVIPPECPILKIKFGPNTGRGMGAHADSPSLDRINPRLGYIPGNVQVLSRRANTMKSNASKEELLAFANWILKEMSA